MIPYEYEYDSKVIGNIILPPIQVSRQEVHCRPLDSAAVPQCRTTPLVRRLHLIHRRGSGEQLTYIELVSSYGR